MRAHMSKDNGFSKSYSSLRAADSHVDSLFYDKLSRKTLILIEKLSSNPKKPVEVIELKARMGINIDALFRILDTLASSEYIKVDLKSGIDPSNDIDMYDLVVTLTEQGEAVARADLFAYQGFVD